MENSCEGHIIWDQELEQDWEKERVKLYECVNITRKLILPSTQVILKLGTWHDVNWRNWNSKIRRTNLVWRLIRKALFFHLLKNCCAVQTASYCQGVENTGLGISKKFQLSKPVCQRWTWNVTDQLHMY
jgi:hypothetical protein